MLNYSEIMQMGMFLVAGRISWFFVASKSVQYDVDLFSKRDEEFETPSSQQHHVLPAQKCKFRKTNRFLRP